jgi:hypothetical protein
MSKRFILGKYLGLTGDELINNERMWKKENSQDSFKADAQTDLGGMGIRNTDLDTFEPTDGDADNETDDAFDAGDDTPPSGNDAGAEGDLDEI